MERRGFSPPGSCDACATLLRVPRETLGGLKARRSTNSTFLALYGGPQFRFSEADEMLQMKKIDLGKLREACEA